tara:strand:+ start:818 stop:1111 length:294 start_codon:yes stop_codon:yes gene_type:complete
MATETVDLYGSIGMTALAELALRRYRQELPLCIAARVTVDTAGQAVAERPHSEVHGLVPLMSQKLEMIAAHDFNRLYTLLAAGRGDLRPSHIRLCTG